MITIVEDGIRAGCAGGRIGAVMPNDFNQFGAQLATWINSVGAAPARRLLLGFDNRRPSAQFVRAVAEGLIGAGFMVEVLGTSPRALARFATTETDDMVLGVYVGEVAEMSGFFGVSVALSGRPLGLAEMTMIAALRPAPAIGRGGLTNRPLYARYVRRLQTGIAIETVPSVFWDAGHGAADTVIGRLMDWLPPAHRLSGKQTLRPPIDRLDAPFSASAMLQLRQNVVSSRLQIGVLFDPNAERCLVVDRTGTVLATPEECPPDAILHALRVAVQWQKTQGAAAIEQVVGRKATVDRAPLATTVMARALVSPPLSAAIAA